MTAVLKTEGLAVGYDGVPVVTGLDIEARAGEVVVLLGPNGAGKTTSLMTIAGDLDPLAGTISMFGSSAPGSLNERVNAGMAVVMDDRSVFTTLTVRENIRLGRAPAEAVTERFPELSDHLDRRVGLLSGGQQQMLGVGRALAAEPGLLLADELSLGLAPLVVRRLLRAVREAADRGAAVLMVEQYARLALEIADRGYVVAGGRVVRSGTALELLSDIHEVERDYLGGGASATPAGPEPDART